jgi:hypothetical protein
MKEGYLMKTRSRLCALVLSICLALSLTPVVSAAQEAEVAVEYTATTKATYTEGSSLTESKTDFSVSFALKSGLVQGDQTGALNWEDGLTRVEAAVLLIRLMGLEEQAAEAADRPSPFTDIPAWANGYMNVAYAQGIAKGVGDGRFDPSGACDARSFLTMLFRLTHLTEGRDFSWSSAVEDFVAAVTQVDREMRNNGNNLVYSNLARDIGNYFQSGGTLTRIAAVDSLYGMLSITAGDQGETLGDILAGEYGMSDQLLYDHCVRRTGWNIPRETTLVLEDYTGETPTVVSVQNGKLIVEDSSGEDLQVGWPGTPYESYTGPVKLPEESCEYTLLYYTQTGNYQNSSGIFPIWTAQERTFYITYQDGSWLISAIDPDSDWYDYAYYYAVQSEDHWAYLREKESRTTRPETPESVQALAQSLTAGKSTEYDKARAICAWVSEHIYYDYPVYRNLETRSQLSDAVLESRRAVCAGYANLTLYLMRAAGLECYTERGLGNGGNHAWNVACLDGQWVVIDNTWDSNLRYWDGEYQKKGASSAWAAVGNLLEPESTWSPTCFDSDLVEFYESHILSGRNPLTVTRKTKNIHDIWIH